MHWHSPSQRAPRYTVTARPTRPPPSFAVRAAAAARTHRPACGDGGRGSAERAAAAWRGWGGCGRRRWVWGRREAGGGRRAAVPPPWRTLVHLGTVGQLCFLWYEKKKEKKTTDENVAYSRRAAAPHNGAVPHGEGPPVTTTKKKKTSNPHTTPAHPPTRPPSLKFACSPSQRESA